MNVEARDHRSKANEPGDVEGGARQERQEQAGWRIRLSKMGKPLFWAALVLGVAIAGAFWWLDRSRFESTENAFVEADIVLLSPQVSGFVSQILVSHNDPVRAGQTVALIDPDEFELRLRSASAKRDEAQAALATLSRRGAERAALLRERDAAIAGAEAERVAALEDRRRFEQLEKKGFATRRTVQSTRATADKAAASVAQARAMRAAESARISSLADEEKELAARIAAARADAGSARLDLDRATLKAPIDGTVGRVLARAGEHVKPGDLVMHIVPARQRYVIANFKETQLRRLRLGQIVEIRLDAFPDRTFEGRIESFSPATGSRFAALPVDNANGNFVKIVQRVPIRIAIEATAEVERIFRPGLSADVRVDVRRQR